MSDDFGWIIPDDWDETSYITRLVCLPDSGQWKGLVNGVISQLTKPFNYRPSTGDFNEAALVGEGIYNSMTDCDLQGTFEELTAAIYAIRDAISQGSCGCEQGQGADTDSGEQGGSVPPPIGDLTYQEPVSVDGRKCKAANLIFETLEDLFKELNTFNVIEMASLGLQAAVGSVAAVFALLSNPVTAAIAAVAGILVVFAAEIIKNQVSMTDILETFDAYPVELVCALYNSSSASGARSNFEAELSNLGLGSLEIELISVLLPNASLNLLFFDTAESASYWDSYTGPVDCNNCIPASQQFEFFSGSGSFNYEGIEFTLSSAPFDTYHLLEFNLPETPTCPQGNWCLEFKSTAGLVTPGTWLRRVQNYYTANCGKATWLVSGAIPPLNDPVLVGAVALANSAPFTVNCVIRPTFRGLGDGTQPYSGTNDCV